MESEKQGISRRMGAGHYFQGGDVTNQEYGLAQQQAKKSAKEVKAEVLLWVLRGLLCW